MPFTIEFRLAGSETWHEITERNTNREAHTAACEWFNRESKPGDTARVVDPKGKVITEYYAPIMPAPVYAKATGNEPGPMLWEREPVFIGEANTHYADYLMRDTGGRATGVEVRWCRHPTALRKYFVTLPNGDWLEHEMGSCAAFRTVGLAKNAAEEWWRAHGKPEPAPMRVPTKITHLAPGGGQLDLFATLEETA